MLKILAATLTLLVPTAFAQGFPPLAPNYSQRLRVGHPLSRYRQRVPLPHPAGISGSRACRRKAQCFWAEYRNGRLRALGKATTALMRLRLGWAIHAFQP
jgi:hypothetical protein